MKDCFAVKELNAFLKKQEPVIEQSRKYLIQVGLVQIVNVSEICNEKWSSSASTEQTQRLIINVLFL